jgi:outer membrane receptor protein involved in Fe transport
MKPRAFLCSLLLIAGVHAATATAATLPIAATTDELSEVIVTATLRASPAAELPQSVSVLDRATLAGAGVEHFGDVLNLVPNLIAAGGTSRPRYFQLRGVGEQEQYQGAPNPSVGFVIDDIDFSGVGMPATLFDAEQIEVLRGPQGTAYGANALAGLINLRTRAAGGEFNANAELNLGDYGTRSAGLALGGGGTPGWRVAAQRYRSNGFRRDVFLKRNDTNGLDEQLLRGKLHWPMGAAVTADLTLMRANLNNGYDAWSVDNTRVTQSDQPGRDAQRSNGAALRITAALEHGELRSVTSAADSRIVFSFDGDWGNNAFWARQAACVPDPGRCVPYDFTSTTARHRRTLAEDLRLVGNDEHRIAGRVRWLVGAYALRLTEDNAQLDLYNGDIYRQLASAYAATSSAFYGQLDWPLSASVSLSTGLRAEQRAAHYDDTDVNRFAPTNQMAGGNLALQWQRSANQQRYLTLARGFRAGGFNIGTSIPAARRQFRPEYLWNLEAGIKGRSHAGRLSANVALFYMRRVDQQVSTSLQTDPSDPLTYQFYTDNAARGENAGFEGQLDWQASGRWRIGGSLALLRARYLDFSYNIVSYDALGNPRVDRRDLSGREQEYAPASQLALNASWRDPRGWFVRVDAQSQSRYFFSASHDQRADARTLVNLRAGWEQGAWSVSGWLRNAFDTPYALHGFYFGNEPPEFAARRYLSPGEPRQIGVTLRYQLPRP